MFPPPRCSGSRFEATTTCFASTRACVRKSTMDGRKPSSPKLASKRLQYEWVSSPALTRTIMLRRSRHWQLFSVFCARPRAPFVLHLVACGRDALLRALVRMPSIK